MGHVVLDPRLLNRVQRITHEALNRRHGSTFKLPYRQLTGSHGITIQPHRAGAALRDTAAVFGAHQAQVIPQGPKQGRIGVDVTDVCQLTVNGHMKRHNIFLID